MTRIDVDLEGVQSMQETIDDLRDRYEDDATWVVGTNVEYGVYLEFGTRDMQPYPWLFPAARHVMASKADRLADESDSTEELVRKVAHAIERQAKENVSADRGSGRSPGTHPDHPKRDTSFLVNGIRAERL